MGARRCELSWDNSLDPIARRKACHHLLPHLVPTRKPIPIPERAAMLAPAHSLDVEGFELACCYPRKLPHDQGVKRMGFSYPPSRSIPSGASPCPGADGQSKDPQRLHQLEARRIDRRCVRERRLRLLLDLWMTKLCGGLVPFGLVKRMATERQIGNPVRATAAAGVDMIQFKRDLVRSTISPSIHILNQD